MRHALVLTAMVATAVALGCGVQRHPGAAPPPRAEQTAARALPFHGRLVLGDPGQLPPAVAASLSSSSPVTFSYREELTHDEYHIPLIFTALDPVTYAGAPVGDFGVTAFASLWITEGGRILGDYTAKVHVSKYYTIYSQPTHKELEEAALAEVRETIDRKLYRDADRLASAVEASKPSSAPIAK